MKQKSFIDTIDAETLAKMIDTTLRYEKRKKNKGGKLNMNNIWKIIPAVAVVILAIILVNNLNIFSNITDTGENAINPGVTSGVSATTEEIQEYIDPYAHVRFGETRDILLLDVEWHTYETYLELIEEWRIRYAEDENYRKSDEQIQDNENVLKYMEEQSDLVKKGEYYLTRFINGLDYTRSSFSCSPEDFINNTDADGYYRYPVYPHLCSASYKDENNIWQHKFFGEVYSLKEYQEVLENEIIPYCDELLEQGLITQEDYDYYTVDNPLDRYVTIFFD